MIKDGRGFVGWLAAKGQPNVGKYGNMPASLANYT